MNRFNKKISTYVSFPLKLNMTPFTSPKIGHQSKSIDEVMLDDDEKKTLVEEENW